MESTIAARLAALRAQIDDELRNCGRPAGSVAVIGVSKKQPADAIRAALRAGLTDVGENYVQEAREKIPALRTASGAAFCAHFIGHVQTNKAKAIVDTFDLVQTVDRFDAAAALAKAATAAGRVLPVLIQLNVSPAERFGCPPADAQSLAEAVRGLSGLRLEGVMAIGPLGARRDEIAKAFELAAKTFDRIGGSMLSIGMSSDWREAVRAGSTAVRIGTALFGERVYEERGASPV